MITTETTITITRSEGDDSDIIEKIQALIIDEESVATLTVKGVPRLFAILGIYEVLSEHFNNEALERAKEIQKQIKKSQLLIQNNHDIDSDKFWDNEYEEELREVTHGIDIEKDD